MSTQLPARWPLWLGAFWPARAAVDRTERLRACGGALFGMLVTAWLSYRLLGDSGAALWLAAPTGASAVLLFATPASPLAQPWSIIGGNLIAALIGVTSARWIASPEWAAAVAVSLAIAAMFALRCLHPPSGAVALTAVLGGPAIHAAGYGLVWLPIELNSLLLLLSALIFNNATGRRYPHFAPPALSHQTQDAAPLTRLGFTASDLDAVLGRYNQVLDISRDDLQELFLQTERAAYQRRFGAANCGRIMSRDIVAVAFGTPLEEAWQLMQQHQLTALPVVDRVRRVIGMLERDDFLRHAQPQSYRHLGERLQTLIRRSTASHSDKPEAAGQIMRPAPASVRADQHFVELVPIMAAGQHHIPVVDHERRLIGLISQSDMVAALYETRLGEIAP
jgi:CBS domain-containing membrane protein